MTLQRINAGIFSGMKTTDLGNSSEYFKPGRYWWRLDSVVMKENRKGIVIFVVEGTIVHAFSDGEGKRPGQPGYSGHVIGDTVSKVANRTSDYFLRDVKRFLHAATGVSPDQISQEDALEACGFDAQGEQTGVKPLDGKYLIICVNAKERARKESDGDDDKPFVFVNFETGPASYSATADDWREVDRVLSDDVQERFFTANGINKIQEWIQARS